MTIDPLDGDFASSLTEGSTETFPQGLTYIPAGGAQYGGAGGADGLSAKASVDLAGTPFAFAESILENNLATFFCTAYDNTPGALSAVEVTSDLKRFNLGATNVDPSIATKTVADCADLGGATITTASFPLQYAGN